MMYGYLSSVYKQINCYAP